MAIFYYRSGNQSTAALPVSGDNPLELGTAFIFAALFVIMIMMTHTVTKYYGVGGLKIFSCLAVFTDIDPFILSLLTGKYSISHQ